MNKRAARKLARSRDFTVGELADKIFDAMEATAASEKSVVNPQIGRLRALNIYLRAIMGDSYSIRNRRNAVIDTTSGRRKTNVLLVTNILRECA